MEKYNVQTKCLNCGYRNYPQWQSIPKGTLVSETECFRCEEEMLVIDELKEEENK